MPSPPFFNHFQGLINKFADRYSSPIFEPHVTIYFGSGDEKNCNRLLNKSLEGFAPITLKVNKVGFSSIYIKTLFIEFAQNPALTKLSERLRTLSKTPTNYSLKPHLSLVYNKMNIKEQQTLADEIKLEWNLIGFDWVKAISTPADIQSENDIASWKYIASLKLKKHIEK
jgi:putative hydrolase of the HAD superfamily